MMQYIETMYSLCVYTFLFKNPLRFVGGVTFALNV